MYLHFITFAVCSGCYSNLCCYKSDTCFTCLIINHQCHLFFKQRYLNRTLQFLGAICYMPIASPGSIRGPHPPRFVPYPINPGTAMFLPETVALRFNIVKQIEYYFSFVV
ncbi:la-related protein 1A-like isoform X3 [Durio zibethinus]|uniref:La-related protein 1A-like isoform X3 n=1 Tax=Durio zibethinus TaxID=66656 RepID=A0A6P5XR19_DURZI|nr:la-related protein 1A-like isoform X3 [Durio zibethinus]